MTREAPIEQDCVDFAEDDGWWVRKVVYVGRDSSPDRWFAKAGILIIVEFKRPDKEPTIKQAREHKRMRAAGLDVRSTDSVEVFKGWIAEANELISARDGAF